MQKLFFIVAFVFHLYSMQQEIIDESLAKSALTCLPLRAQAMVQLFKKDTAIFLAVLLIFKVQGTFPILNGEKIDHITKELSKRVAIDQAARSKINVSRVDAAAWREVEEIDQENTEFLKEVLRDCFWLKVSVFGQEADCQAWLLAQHADHDREFQKEILSRLEHLYPLRETSAKNYAYLYDRVAMHDKRPQRYGTQGFVDNGEWSPYEIEDIVAVDERRESVGLASLEKYKEQIKRAYSL